MPRPDTVLKIGIKFEAYIKRVPKNNVGFFNYCTHGINVATCINVAYIIICENVPRKDT